MVVVVRRDGRYEFIKRNVTPRNTRTYTEISIHGTSRIVIYGGTIGYCAINLSEPIGELCLDVGVAILKCSLTPPDVEVKYIGNMVGRKEYAVYIDGNYLFTYTGLGLLKILDDKGDVVLC